LDRKSQIIKLIELHPGIHQGDLARKSGLEHGVLIHHLDRLEKNSTIRSQKHGKYKRYYPLDVKEEEFCILRNLVKKSKKDLLITLIINGNQSFRELTKTTEKSPSTTSWNLSSLIEEGIIEKCVVNGKEVYQIKNKKLFRSFFEKHLPQIFDDEYEHAEDIFLAL